MTRPDSSDFDAKAATLASVEEAEGWAEGIRLCPSDQDDKRREAVARRMAELRRTQRMAQHRRAGR